MASCSSRAAEVVSAAEEDVLAYMAFPAEHGTHIHATKPLERLNGETGVLKQLAQLSPRRSRRRAGPLALNLRRNARLSVSLDLL